MTSFRKFLTENSSLNSKNYNYSCYDSYLDEELKTDEQAIKQLQDREFEIRKRIQSSQEKLYKLQDKSSSLQERISKMLVYIMNSHVTGKEYSQVVKQFEEDKKELEKLKHSLRTYLVIDNLLSKDYRLSILIDSLISKHYKLTNECDMYRLVSPNYNGQFEFNIPEPFI